MLNRKSYLTALIIALVVVAISGVGYAFADTVTVVITGQAGPNMTTGGNQILTGVTLDGTDQTTSGNLGTYDVIDARGTGLGWNVVIGATDFEKQGDPAKKILASGFQLTPAPAVNTVAGNAAPSSYSGNLGSGFKLLSAAVGAGMGEYQVTPAVTLDVPAETYAGTYDSTVTATVASGP